MSSTTPQPGGAHSGGAHSGGAHAGGGERLDALGMPVGVSLRPEYEVTPRHAKALLDARQLVLVDCRTLEEWKLVHVAGSVHIPLDEIERRSDEIERSAGQELAVMCHHGVRSLKAALALRQLGHLDAMSVAGGIDLWSVAADAGVLRYARSGGVCTPMHDAR
jgi:rhodanese-related sulfurtransferase